MKKASKKKRVSEMLADETKKMELKLQEVKALMEKEKTKPKPTIDQNGNIWRSATSTKPIQGYSQYILEKHEEEKKMRAKKLGATKKKVTISKAEPEPTSNAVEEPKKESEIQVGGTNELKPKQEIAVSLKEEAAKETTQLNSNSEVDEFLTSIGMIKYKPLFLQNGIEDIETILELQDNHFQIMNIPLGHKLKMLKRIKEIKLSQHPEAEVAVPDTTQQEELKDIKVEAEPEIKKVRFEEPPKESKEEPTNEISQAIISKDRPDDKQLEESNKENNMQNENKQNGADFISVDCETKMGEMPSKTSSCCWHCYKLFDKSNGYSDPSINKDFCSEACNKKHREQNQIKCSKAMCNKGFLKIEGFLEQGKWYCSEKCYQELVSDEAKKEKEDAKEQEQISQDIMNI